MSKKILIIMIVITSLFFLGCVVRPARRAAPRPVVKAVPPPKVIVPAPVVVAPRPVVIVP